jgi:hypothetical protein
MSGIERGYQSDPAMGSMIDDSDGAMNSRVNTLAQTAGTTSYLDNHVKELEGTIQRLDDSNRGLYRLLVKMRGSVPEEASCGVDQPEPDSLMNHFNLLENHLSAAANLYGRQLDELAGLI